MGFSYYAELVQGFQVELEYIKTQKPRCDHEFDRAAQKFCSTCGQEAYYTRHTRKHEDLLVFDDNEGSCGYRGLLAMSSESDNTTLYLGHRLSTIEPRDGDVKKIDMAAAPQLDWDKWRAQILADGFKIKDEGLFLVSSAW